MKFSGSMAISVLVAVYSLAVAVLGIFGKTMPFSGINKYTDESLKKGARIMCAPAFVSAIAFSVATYFNIVNKFSYTAYFIAIGLLLVQFVIKIVVVKKVYEVE